MLVRGLVFKVEGGRMLLSTPDWGFQELPVPHEPPAVGSEIWIELPARAQPRLRRPRWLAAAAVAAFLLVATPAFAFFQPVATVSLQGQGSYTMRVNLFGRVVALAGADARGRAASASLHVWGQPVGSAVRALYAADAPLPGQGAQTWYVSARGLHASAWVAVIRASLNGQAVRVLPPAAAPEAPPSQPSPRMDDSLVPHRTRVREGAASMGNPSSEKAAAATPPAAAAPAGGAASGLPTSAPNGTATATDHGSASGMKAPGQPVTSGTGAATTTGSTYAAPAETTPVSSGSTPTTTTMPAPGSTTSPGTSPGGTTAPSSTTSNMTSQPGTR